MVRYLVFRRAAAPPPPMLTKGQWEAAAKIGGAENIKELGLQYVLAVEVRCLSFVLRCLSFLLPPRLSLFSLPLCPLFASRYLFALSSFNVTARVFARCFKRLSAFQHMFQYFSTRAGAFWRCKGGDVKAMPMLANCLMTLAFHVCVCARGIAWRHRVNLWCWSWIGGAKEPAMPRSGSGLTRQQWSRRWLSNKSNLPFQRYRPTVSPCLPSIRAAPGPIVCGVLLCRQEVCAVRGRGEGIGYGVCQSQECASRIVCASLNNAPPNLQVDK